MQTEVIISGFGGQGTLFAGQMLSYAAMDAGKEVTWIPSYGPEMRGGTANCTVVVSDEEIGSPLARNPKAAIVMNLPSLDKYEPLLQPGGVLVVNTSMVNREPTRKDIKVVLLPANDIAEKLGGQRLANMVMLGALLGNLPTMVTLEDLEAAVKAHLPARHQKFLPANLTAIREGAAVKAQ
ncbi:MAG TPA: 2-oxoacid:acceptor oxidoreductase family protein [Anaerolineaceae bacterium]|nr:2-oxoacid:acceptor oxidoreductase family protein [Anaerolineaceae bacterium]HPN53816.1 2-oxoacid:acceptor oxidoreductase family protein [Anaerolineaceae bacterium]